MESPKDLETLLIPASTSTRGQYNTDTGTTRAGRRWLGQGLSYVLAAKYAAVNLMLPVQEAVAPLVQRGQRWVAQRKLFYVMAFFISCWTIAGIYFYFAVVHKLTTTHAETLCVDLSGCKATVELSELLDILSWVGSPTLNVLSKLKDLKDKLEEYQPPFTVSGVQTFGPALLIIALPTVFFLYAVNMAFSLAAQPRVFTAMQIMCAISFVACTVEYYFGKGRLAYSTTAQLLMAISTSIFFFFLILSSTWSSANHMRLQLALENAARDFDASGNAKAAIAIRSLVKASGEKLVQLHMDLEMARSQIADFERVMQIRGDDIRLMKKIGKGASGDVWLADSIVSDKPVAVKLLRGVTEGLVLGQDAHAVEELEREAEALRSLRHRNIILFHGAGSKDGRIMLVTEYMERGTLRDVLDTPTMELPAAMRLGFALDVALGLEYLHSRDPCRVHRDLKTPNLLVTASYVIKLADFGSVKPLHGMKDMLSLQSSKAAQQCDVSETAFSSQDDNSSDLLHTSFVGTLLWQAPEVLDGTTDYGPAVDVFSFAIVMYEIATRVLPWRDVKYHWTIRDNVMAGERPAKADCAKVMSKHYCDLMARCWAQEPGDRPNMRQVELELRAQQRAAEVLLEGTSA